jgi:hypothetical protein
VSTTMKRTIAGALLSGVGAVATLGLVAFGPGTGTAQAEGRCDPVCHGTWCPGEPATLGIAQLVKTWDQSVCHEYHQVSGQPGVYAEGPLPPGSPQCPPISFLCP